MCDTPQNCSQIFSNSYDQAVTMCRNHIYDQDPNIVNFRLCTKDELESNICCKTGGNCDLHLVWTSTQSLSSDEGRTDKPGRTGNPGRPGNPGVPGEPADGKNSIY